MASTKPLLSIAVGLCLSAISCLFPVDAWHRSFVLHSRDMRDIAKESSFPIITLCLTITRRGRGWPDVVKRSNALELMRAVGLDV